MQISDMLGQYNRNVTNGTEELNSSQSAQKLVSTVGDLAAGNVFEGTVNQVKNGRVVLALGNGQVLTARMDGKVELTPGSSMFFQVKSNENGMVLIRPYTGAGNVGNPILLNALTAAQIPVNQRNLTMVDSMMKEQLPIDKQSLADMAKILNANPKVDVGTIVQMTKMGMPVSEAMASQYESYLSNNHAILNEMETAVSEFTMVLADETLTSDEAFSLYNKVMNVLSETGQGTLPTGENAVAIGQGNPQGADGLQGTIIAQEADALQGTMAAQPENLQGTQQESAQGTSQRANMEVPLNHLLNEEQLANLTKTLQNIPTLVGNTEIFNAAPEELFVDTLPEEELSKDIAKLVENFNEGHVQVQKDLTTGEFLKAVQTVLAEHSEYGFAGVSKLFASPEFQMIFHHTMSRKWLIKPEELKESGKLNEVYTKMEHQLHQMEQIVRQANIGDAKNGFLQASAEVRGNVEFMNQMNQIYSYVQMPLRMSGQNANGELYVYRNKKQIEDPEAELTAFLHLEMEHLGTTDVSVKMKDKKVKTNFYFSDDASYDLVKKHLPILEKHLAQKGYQCTITVSNEKANSNFKETILQKPQSDRGILQRYSFDVRA